VVKQEEIKRQPRASKTKSLELIYGFLDVSIFQKLAP
jgi:hypothetical protein